MEPHEILASESQERMLLIVTPENLRGVLSICARWGVLATAIGEVTAEAVGRPAASPGGAGSRGRRAAGLARRRRSGLRPADARAGRPTCCRPVDRAETLPRPGPARSCARPCCGMVASPNLCDKTWVTEQYDRYVLGNTVLAQPEDAGVLRIDEQTGLGIALSVDGNGRFARLDPYTARSWRWPRRTATSPSPAPCRSRSPTASTSARPRTRRDVAVRRGRARAGRRLRRAGHPGDRRQRQLLQPDRRRGDPPRRRWSGCSACSRTWPPGCRWASAATATRSSCSARPGRSCPARSGPR